jgi:hypothetical protein
MFVLAFDEKCPWHGLLVMDRYRYNEAVVKTTDMIR